MVRFSKTILLLLAFHSFCFAQTIQQNSSAIGILGSLEFGPILWKSSDLAVPDFANTFGIKGRLNYGINEMFSAGIAYTQSFRFPEYEDEDLEYDDSGLIGDTEIGLDGRQEFDIYDEEDPFGR